MSRKLQCQRVTATVALAGVLVTALWLADSPSALACSCEGMSNSAIERADAAVIGTIAAMTSIEPEFRDQDRFVAEVEVSDDLKDNLADVIYVTSERDDGGNCGVTWQQGTQIAAAIYEEDGVLRSDACSEMSPILAANWQPAVTIGGHATLLIAGDGPNRLVAYDQDATPIAFSFEPGWVHALSVCPGNQVVIEAVNTNNEPPVFALRSLTTFEIVDTIPAVVDGTYFIVSDVRCESPDGSAFNTNIFQARDGVLTASDEPLVPSSPMHDDFWPELVTSTTAPIPGEFWMSTAVELDAPVAIDGTGASSPIRQLGSGESFGLDTQANDSPLPSTEVETESEADQTAAGDDENDELAAGAEPSTDTNSNAALWIIAGLALVVAVAGALMLQRRPQRS